ncbi:MAG TPA: SCP2 sterol-binding domain-containing protein [Usitatibacter sp.]|nr:SCP2 sterol-binding domain-containing protein [Usitatibacter sp.]
MRKSSFTIAAVASLAAVHAWAADPVLMSADWARAACTAWNADAVLPVKLQESGWADNNKKRGHKVLRIARTDCPSSPKVELRIAPKDGRAQCIEGRVADATAIDTDVDYLMTAETKRWSEMGRGEYGPMRAMMFGRLKFDGPMTEAMGNMGPFESFLLLVGKVPGDPGSCPK